MQLLQDAEYTSPARIKHRLEAFLGREGLSGTIVGVELNVGLCVDLRWAVNRIAQTRSPQSVLEEYRSDRQNAQGYPVEELDDLPPS